MEGTRRLVIVMLAISAGVVALAWLARGPGRGERVRATAAASLPEAAPAGQLVQAAMPQRDEVALSSAPAAEPSSTPALVGRETHVAWLRRLLPERYGTLDDAALLALEELDLRGAELTDADLLHLAMFPNLARLSLRGTAVSDAGMAALTRLPLTWLDLRGTAVSGDAFPLLPVTRLEALHLTDTKVSEADLARLPSLPLLKTLKLNFLALSDLSIETLAAQPNLRHVELDGTQLSDDGLRRLLELLPSVTRVEARNTHVSGLLAAELATMRPGLEIVLD
jgi:hypothetical protein